MLLNLFTHTLLPFTVQVILELRKNFEHSIAPKTLKKEKELLLRDHSQCKNLGSSYVHLKLQIGLNIYYKRRLNNLIEIILESSFKNILSPTFNLAYCQLDR